MPTVTESGSLPYPQIVHISQCSFIVEPSHGDQPTAEVIESVVGATVAKDVCSLPQVPAAGGIEQPFEVLGACFLSVFRYWAIRSLHRALRFAILFLLISTFRR